MNDAAKRHRRIRNFWLDGSYQLRYTVVMVLISTILTAGLGSFWYREARDKSAIIALQVGADPSEAGAATLRRMAAAEDQKRLIILTAFGLCFAVLVAGNAVVMTHKVAGPLYRIGRQMIDIREGRLFTLRRIRHGDKLWDFFEVFRSMHNGLREQAAHDAEVLGSVIEQLEGQLSRLKADDPSAEGLRSSLEAAQALRDEKIKSLGG